MTFASDMRTAVSEMMENLGTTATLQSIVATYDEAGTVSETVTTVTIDCSDVLTDTTSLAPDGTHRVASGEVYVAALDLSTAPKTGDRIVYQTRRFEVVTVETYRAQATVIAYRCTVQELGAT